MHKEMCKDVSHIQVLLEGCLDDDEILEEGFEVIMVALLASAMTCTSSLLLMDFKESRSRAELFTKLLDLFILSSEFAGIDLSEFSMDPSELKSVDDFLESLDD